MMRVSEFKDYLKQQFPDIKFFNGAIDKNSKQCVGIYARGSVQPRIALGGVTNTSYASLPITLLIHWTENADACEQMANEIYNKLFGLSDFVIGDRRIIQIQALDPCPVNVARDEKNIVEMTIRLNIIYEREVM